ncbi:MAG: UDP-N-acetylglucosamine 2-epimerase [Candidatus Dojkabacteria bacterium]|nr:UDP-N-acetylglucosamine 2-epimerase [Candidatus Dojkabacteria bacterium]
MVECQKRGIKYNFVFLAQHKETMYEMMDKFGIQSPNYVLGDVGKDITSAASMFFWSIKVVIRGVLNLKKMFQGDREGVVLVHGDAPPVLLGALLAKLYGLKVAHVEAGLRSFNYLHPFPEELTRVITWRLGLVNYYFCQNEIALKNVEKYRGKKYLTKYNTLFDSWELAKLADSKTKVDIPRTKYAIVTIHRFETISRRTQTEAMVKILEKVGKKMNLLFILHPPTKVALEKFELIDRLKKNKNIELRPRYNFFEFSKLVRSAEYLISDGGSNQEESFYIGKPCLLLRYTTERTEGIGKNVVISKFDMRIVEDFVNNYEKYKISPKKFVKSPSEYIIDVLK